MRGRGGPVAVLVRVRTGDGRLYPETGRIDFIDPQVDRSTDTILVRAVIANPPIDRSAVSGAGGADRRLIDGMFVAVFVEGPETGDAAWETGDGQARVAEHDATGAVLIKDAAGNVVGSAGASGYDIERAPQAAGPWTTLATNSSDADIAYRPLFSDTKITWDESFTYSFRRLNNAHEKCVCIFIVAIRKFQTAIACEQAVGFSGKITSNFRLIGKIMKHGCSIFGLPMKKEHFHMSKNH
jgi:hypothetical protein